jgi:hypothetical protein
LQLAKASAATLLKNKASAATLSQQEENDSADVQGAELIYPAFSVQRRSTTDTYLYRWRLRHKTLAWASGSAAEDSV